MMRTLAVVLLLAGVAAAEPMKITPNRNWVAVNRDEKLKAKAPKNNLITDAKTFETVWKAWRKDEKVPEVDFKKEFAFVAICLTKRESPVPRAALRNGDLGVSWDAARRGRRGWGYAILTFDRKGVKKVNGKELEP